ncbi:DMT family transporter [Desulfurivibrio sp. D14AmB]|uniref:DMT family transporter n=1 Tax=Desulfurivibrio sp. D14AmB TaxID=3374370 RepID=UPI00376EA468
MVQPTSRNGISPNPALREQRKGETFLLAEEFLWGWFPIVTLLSYQFVDPLWAMAITIFVATLFFAGIMQVRGLWPELRRREAWTDLFWASFYILLLFVLLFVGLSYTTAGNAALILFLQVLFAYLYFNLFKGEAMTPTHKAGVALVSIGAFLVLFPDEMGFNRGDLLVLLAAMVAPVGNRYQQRARRHVNATTLLFVRNLFSLPLLFPLAWLLAAAHPDLEAIAATWWLLLLNGLFLMGLSKIFWIEGLHRLAITKVSAMTALSPLFTMIFAYPVLGEIPGRWQLGGILPILLGGILITRPAAGGPPPKGCRPGR